ncbi:MAG TPA: UDP-glucose 4-epimerase GalE [Saprospiraceae bacterium]|nr:UDP-glucose 4-epimerase GalE [Saprospiraceae bacterium]
MNILVTGGAGFIGSHTVVALQEAGFRPIILDDFSNSQPSALQGLEKILGYPPRCYAEDCNHADTLRRIFREEDIRGVIHFAAFKAVGESMEQPLKYYANNVGSLITLLQVMLEMGVGDLIFSSSCTVYGEPDRLPVTEHTPVQPAASVYGNTKQVGEEILHDTVRALRNVPSGATLRTISLRYFNPIGAHPSAHIGELPLGVPNNLVPFITQSAAGLRPALRVHGDDYATPDGTGIRDYIHVMDLAEAHVAALRHLRGSVRQPSYAVYNVGTGRGYSVLEVIRAFESVSGGRFEYQIGPRRPGDVPAVYADVSKATQELGWTARRSLHEALADAWRWQQRLGILAGV